RRAHGAGRLGHLRRDRPSAGGGAGRRAGLGRGAGRVPPRPGSRARRGQRRGRRVPRGRPDDPGAVRRPGGSRGALGQNGRRAHRDRLRRSGAARFPHRRRGAAGTRGMRGTLSLRSAVLLAAAVLLQAGAVWGSAQGAARDWPQFGGDASGTRFSALDQVNVGNVADLRVAWVADLGFTGRVQGAPAAWDGALFVSTEWGVLALDGATGAELWRYQEGTGDRTSTGLPLQAPRGSPVVVADVGGVNVYAALPSSPAVVALAADTGELRSRTDVSNPDFAEALRTNPILAGDVLLVGPTGADLSPVPGRLVALDRASGETAWTFDLVPVAEDDPARSTWGPYPPGRRYGIGGGSAWNVGAYDPISDVVVFGTGQPIPSDNLDPRRHDGDAPVTADLYTASFVGIDAATGTLRWFHQVVPGDEWGYDQHTVPVIVDLPTDEGGVRAALLATTTGFLLVVDVTSGELLDAHRMFEGNVHLGYDDEGRPVIDEAMRRASPDDVVRV